MVQSAFLFAQGGQLDASFGNGGKAIVDGGEFDDCRGVVVLSDGKLLVYGQTADFAGGFNFDAMIVKLNVDGSLDSSFGSGGVLRFDFPDQYNSRIVEMKLDGSELILIGESNPNSSLDTLTLWIAKLALDGSPDSTFGSNGFYTEQFSTTFTQAGDVEIDDSGRVVFCGTVVDTSGLHQEFPLLGRLNSNGMRDSSFGSAGVVSWHPQNGVINRHSDGAEACDLFLMEDHYFISGFTYLGDQTLGFTMKFWDDGRIDSTYGFPSDGTYTLNLSPGYNSSAVKSFEIGDTIYTACQSEVNLDYSNFQMRSYSNGNWFLGNSVYDFGGNDNQLKDALWDGQFLYLAGYSRFASSNGVGWQSDYFGCVAVDLGLGLVSGFGNSGYFTADFGGGFETGASAISDYDSSRIILGGYINVNDTNNYTDIGLMRLSKAELSSSRSEPVDRRLKVWPNPAGDVIHVAGFKGAEFSVVAADGRQVLSGRVDGQVVKLESLPKGIYVVRIDGKSARIIHH